MNSTIYTYPSGTVEIHTDCLVDEPEKVLENISNILSEWAGRKEKT